MPSFLASRLRTVAVCWIAVAVVAYAIDLWRQTHDHLTNGALRPFGDDFINYWSGAFLAWHGRAADVYNWNAFHAFEQSVAGAPIDFYHYSYPPVLLILTAPLAIIPYVPALFAWLITGWLGFYAGLRAVLPGKDGLLLALAGPAVFINAVGGQNGTWTAALLGGGLTLLDRRPVLAGMLFGLLIYKPQLGILLPVMLIVGWHVRAFVSAAVTAGFLIVVSLWLFGADLWLTYFQHASVLRHVILEDNSGVWHRMVAVFVFAQRLGASVPLAYGIQAAVALVVAVFVVVAGIRRTPSSARNILVVLGTCLATPYLQDYDLVVGAFVVVWLAQLYPSGRMTTAGVAAAALILTVPFVASLLAHITGLEFGPLFIAPAFVIAAAFALSPVSSHVSTDAPKL